jgi:hypothetical protein
MDDLKAKLDAQNAALQIFHSVGMKPLSGSMGTITAKLAEFGVTAHRSEHGYPELRLADGTAVVPSAAAEKVRAAIPDAFVSDPRRDKFTSKEDFRGSPTEIAQAKATAISAIGIAKWENLPNTRAEAERRAIVPSPDMNRKDYLSMSRQDRADLSGLIGPEGIQLIMSRTK